MKSLPTFILICLLAIPALGQLFCDVNGDSSFTGSDINRLVAILNGPPDNFNVCDIICDIDNDGEAMTIADMALVLFFLQNPDGVPPYFTYHPAGDTLEVGSTQASPGDQISLPLYLRSMDTLIAYELFIKVNSLYLSIEDFIPNDELEFNHPFSSSQLHIIYMGAELFVDSLFYYPDSYHLGDLVVNVNPDITEPVTTYIEFGSCPEDNFYTGLANMTFFVPVLVDGEITITPTAIDDEHLSLPSVTSIEAYPNPFNSSVNLQVESDRADRLIIYDVLGREINSYPIESGSNIITWNGVERDGKPVNAGIYFARLEGSAKKTIKKLLLIK